MQGLSAPTVLVSSEDFEVLYADRESLCRLRDLASTAGRTAMVMVTLREPANYLESLYAELLVRNRSTAPRRLVDRLRRNSLPVFRLPEETRARFEGFELTRQRLLATHGRPS